jgi:hypothetical protein
MAHFAEIDEDGVVLRVLVVDDSYDDDASGQQFLAETCNLGGIWKKTSYNTNSNTHKLNGTPFRGNYAGIGMIYDADLDIFISPKPHQSWFLNEETCRWEAPTPMPEDGKLYQWDEATLAWVELPTE